MQAKKNTFITKLFSTSNATDTAVSSNYKNKNTQPPIIPQQVQKIQNQAALESYLKANLSEGNSFLEALSEPAIITTREGVPRMANLSYISLCQLASLSVRGRPPFLDRLFSHEDISKYLFRLSQAVAKGLTKSVTLPSVVIGTRLPCPYKIEVSPLGERNALWRIYQQEETKTESFIDQFHWKKFPFGIFEIDEKGYVCSVNQCLLDWLEIQNLEADTRIETLFGEHASLLEQEMKTSSKKENQLYQVQIPFLKALDTEVDIILSYILSGEIVRHTLGFVIPKYKSQPIKQVDASGVEVIIDVFSNGPVGLAKLEGKKLSEAKIIQVNDTLTEMTQGAAKTGAGFTSLFLEDELYKERHALLLDSDGLQKEPYECCLSGKPARMTNVYLLPYEKGMGYIVLFFDISMQKDLEEQLFQSQKMQVVGQLAGGVAHDFNNLLTVIRLNCDELLGRHPVGDPSYSELKMINQTVARAAGLVRKLLAFSRKQTLHSTVLDIGAVLSDFSILIKQILQENIKFEIIHGRNLPSIKVDKGQLETALMNLVTNARDAMQGQKNSCLTIETGLAGQEEVTGYGEEPLPEGKFIIIKISDTGMGIEEEMLKKIFEPFFTTKEIGKGTGLGLATVYGIVRQTGGYLFVDSQVGKGTSFKIFLPVYEEKPLEITTVGKKEKDRQEDRKPLDLAGKGLILIVEDESAVRVIAAKTLRKRGYEVLEAEDGEMALELIEERQGEIDLMISDVVMPGMDGATLLETARESLGNARVIFISGYAEEEFSETLSRESYISFLPKPFTLTQLAEKVKLELSE